MARTAMALMNFCGDRLRWKQAIVSYDFVNPIRTVSDPRTFTASCLIHNQAMQRFLLVVVLQDPAWLLDRRVADLVADGHYLEVC